MTSQLSTVGLLILLLLSAGCRSSTPETKPEPAPTQVAVEKPSLSCEVANVSVYPVPNNRENLAISIVASVRNSGAPTMAEQWELQVDTPGRNDLTGLDAVHVNGLVEMPGSKGTRIDLGKEDLAIKSKQSPIAKHTVVSGVLTFVLPKVSLKDLSNNNSSFILHFKDNQGGSYESKRVTLGDKR